MKDVYCNRFCCCLIMFYLMLMFVYVHFRDLANWFCLPFVVRLCFVQCLERCKSVYLNVS